MRAGFSQLLEMKLAGSLTPPSHAVGRIIVPKSNRFFLKQHRADQSPPPTVGCAVHAMTSHEDTSTSNQILPVAVIFLSCPSA